MRSEVEKVWVRLSIMRCMAKAPAPCNVCCLSSGEIVVENFTLLVENRRLVSSASPFHERSERRVKLTGVVFIGKRARERFRTNDEAAYTMALSLCCVMLQCSVE